MAYRIRNNKYFINQDNDLMLFPGALDISRLVFIERVFWRGGRSSVLLAGRLPEALEFMPQLEGGGSLMVFHRECDQPLERRPVAELFLGEVLNKWIPHLTIQSTSDVALVQMYWNIACEVKFI